MIARYCGQAQAKVGKQNHLGYEEGHLSVSGSGGANWGPVEVLVSTPERGVIEIRLEPDQVEKLQDLLTFATDITEYDQEMES